MRDEAERVHLSFNLAFNIFEHPFSLLRPIIPRQLALKLPTAAVEPMLLTSIIWLHRQSTVATKLSP